MQITDIDITMDATAEATAPPDLLEVAEMELSQEAFTRLVLKLAGEQLTPSKYIDFIEGERNESRLRTPAQG